MQDTSYQGLQSFNKGPNSKCFVGSVVSFPLAVGHA